MNELVAMPAETRFLKSLVKQFNKDGSPVKKVSFSRSESLIVPKVSYANNAGCLHNEHWAYKVPFAFCDAMDIKLIKRSKKVACYDDNGNAELDADGNKKTKDWYYSVWTQSCWLSFSNGDFFECSNGQPSIQVVSARPVAWDAINGVLDDGEVVFQSFDKTGLGDFVTLSQFEFLGILIDGRDGDDHAVFYLSER